MSPEQAFDTRVAAGRFQRADAESSMNALQRVAGGGVMPVAAEHIGDLTHRMNKNPQHIDTTMGDVMPKVDRQSANLNSRYGFEREHAENLGGNARYRGVPASEHALSVAVAGQNYADAHRGVPVYNYPSEVGRDAAISLGEQRYGDTRTHLSTLSAMQHGGEDSSGEGWAEGDMRGLLEGRPDSMHQQGMVDYLRGKEAATPAITDAATAMLGGRLRK